jgi:hypothetical protein
MITHYKCKSVFSVSNQSLIVDYDCATIEVTGDSTGKLYPEIIARVKPLLNRKFTPKGLSLRLYLYGGIK